METFVPAVEGSVMAQGVNDAFGMPLWRAYLLSSLLIIPLVIYRMKALSKLHVWTERRWLLLVSLVMSLSPQAYRDSAS